MSDDLSIEYNEDTPRLLAKRARSKRGLGLLIAIFANAAFYIYGYFTNNSIWDEGEGFAYHVLLVWGLGAFIFYEIVTFYPSLNPSIGNGDEDIRHENGLMKAFQCIGLHEKRARMTFLAGVFGAINVIVYLGFLTATYR